MGYANAGNTGLGSFTPEDDNVSHNVAAAVDDSNPLIQKARQDGLDMANARGLGNSSIASGAAEAQAYKIALPIGQQQAQQAAAKNVTNQNFEQSQALQTSQDQNKLELQRQDNAAQSGRLTQQLGSNEAIAARDAQNKLALQGMDNDSRQLIAQMNVTSNQQDKAQSAALQSYNIYAGLVNNINNNKDIPADVRTAYLAKAKSEFSANVGLIEQLYNIDVNWGGDTATPAAPASAGSFGATSTPATPDQAAANYGGGNPAPDTSGQQDQSLTNQVSYTDPDGNQYNAYGQIIGRAS